MAENPRGRVTITLGRTGQVVERASTLSDGTYSHLCGAENKRSVMDRLSNSSSTASAGNTTDGKRQKRDPSLSSVRDSEDLLMAEEDLRFKLMQKNASKTSQHNDLRERLSKMTYSTVTSTSALSPCQKIPKRDVSSAPQCPAPAAADALPSFSAWSFDEPNQRSAAKPVCSSWAMPVSKSFSEHSGGSRVLDDVSAISYAKRDAAFDAPRCMSSSSGFVPKSALPGRSSHLGSHFLFRGFPLGSIAPKSSFMENHESVESLLNSLGLGKYTILFKAEEVDMAALRQMGEQDLKELGIPMGPRKKILLALMQSSRRQPI